MLDGITRVAEFEQLDERAAEPELLDGLETTASDADAGVARLGAAARPRADELRQRASRRVELDAPAASTTGLIDLDVDARRRQRSRRRRGVDVDQDLP